MQLKSIQRQEREVVQGKQGGIVCIVFEGCEAISRMGLVLNYKLNEQLNYFAHLYVDDNNCSPAVYNGRQNGIHCRLRTGHHNI